MSIVVISMLWRRRKDRFMRLLRILKRNTGIYRTVFLEHPHQNQAQILKYFSSRKDLTGTANFLKHPYTLVVWTSTFLKLTESGARQSLREKICVRLPHARWIENRTVSRSFMAVKLFQSPVEPCTYGFTFRKASYVWWIW